MDDFPIHFGGTDVLNLSLKQPLRAESRAELDPHGARLGAVVPDVMPESQKQRVRRLAAHCQTYRGSVPRLAIQQLVTTLVPLVLVIGAMFATVEHAYWATLLLALPAAGLLVRAFIIQHDCGHGSFFASRPVNDFVGRCMSVLTFAPYGLWRREHAQHHATSGNLDRRGAGDIGTHFPPSDPQWKGAASHLFVEHAARLVRERGGRIANADITLICEAPRVGPHRETMTAALSRMLGISPDRISIKATTNERLGFVGREEGIAAIATASVVFPGEVPE